MTTASDVAIWMFEELQRKDVLDQADAAAQIQRKFGKEFIYENENGNLAIRRDVLAEFRKFAPDWIVWDRRNHEWRNRHSSDKPGRQQD
jgi:hypothetical protein